MHAIRSLLVASAFLSGIGAAAAAAERTESVKLRAGGHSVSRSDTITGNDTLSYRFKGAKGDKLNVNLVSTHGACRFDLYAPGMAAPMYLGVAPASAFSGSLPESGDYLVKVRADAAGGKSCGFNLAFRLHR